MTRKEIIDHLTPIFIEELDRITNMYKLIGVSGDFARRNGIGFGTYDESPMWLQYKGPNIEMNAIRFECSLSDLGFEIPLNTKDIETLMFSRGGFSGVYDYFKKVKYEHIRDNHPTVWDEQRFHFPRINSFLNIYESL
jgi:hypothetical protein